MKEVYEQRRARVRAELGSGILVVFSAPVRYRNNDVVDDYRQNSDFYYLSGFEEPESAILLLGDAEEPFNVFLRPRDPEREQWDGPRLGLQGAREVLGADVAFPIAELPTQLAAMLKGKERLYYRMGDDDGRDRLVLDALNRVRAVMRRGGVYPDTIVEPGRVLHELRLRKEPAEIAHAERAAQITASGYRVAMRGVHAGMMEYQLQALVEEQYRTHGAERCAFATIVASGPNATVLHHRRNDRRIQQGELVLLDAGAEYEYMAADVTRTFPVDGRFTEIQRRVYEIVLRAQTAAINRVRPGATLEEIHEASIAELSQGLVELAVLKDDVKSIIESAAHKKYTIHRASHWLGMDVHDVGAYLVAGKPRPLLPGMMLTVEPGLYFSQDDAAIPEELRGIGVRIEDDVLVVDDGHKVLTASIPKSVEEIERECAMDGNDVCVP
jgi:Xaa-Pro aminopeptidase